MYKTFEERVAEAKEQILPILKEFNLDLGSRHFLKANVKDAKNLLDYLDSEVTWLDLAPKQVVGNEIHAVAEEPKSVENKENVEAKEEDK